MTAMTTTPDDVLTPRTDAAMVDCGKLSSPLTMYGYMTEHATQLERELAQAAARIAGLAAQLAEANAMYHSAIDMGESVSQRAEAAEAKAEGLATKLADQKQLADDAAADSVRLHREKMVEWERAEGLAAEVAEQKKWRGVMTEIADTNQQRVAQLEAKLASAQADAEKQRRRKEHYKRFYLEATDHAEDEGTKEGLENIALGGDMAQIQADALRYQSLLDDPETGRHLLLLLLQKRGDQTSFRKMQDRIKASKDAALKDQRT